MEFREADYGRSNSVLEEVKDHTQKKDVRELRSSKETIGLGVLNLGFEV